MLRVRKAGKVVFMKKIYLLGLIGALSLLASCQTTSERPAMKDLGSISTIFLVRHAEKTAEKNDPSLTMQGQQRAEQLADLLADAEITRIYSSDYVRTRDTAAPLAKQLGLDVEIYDAGDLQAIASKLRSEDERALVVGHSNTTPELVELLGGEGGEPIVEATEYDRLYIVSKAPEDGATTLLLRFGP